MTAAVFAEEGYADLLATMLRQALWYAHLFTNDVDVSKSTKKADLVECVAAGYVRLPVDRWTPPMLRAGVAFSLSDPLIWTLAPAPAPLPVRGYYVTNGVDGALLWAWRRPGPGWLPVEGNATLIVYVKFNFPPPATA